VASWLAALTAREAREQGPRPGRRRQGAQQREGARVERQPPPVDQPRDGHGGERLGDARDAGQGRGLDRLAALAVGRPVRPAEHQLPVPGERRLGAGQVPARHAVADGLVEGGRIGGRGRADRMPGGGRRGRRQQAGAGGGGGHGAQQQHAAAGQTRRGPVGVVGAPHRESACWN
jgi:hypothetical protein